MSCYTGIRALREANRRRRSRSVFSSQMILCMTMASTRSRMIGVVLFVAALSALEAIRWDGGPADKASITACVGGTATIPWSFVNQSTGSTVTIAWWFEAPGKEKTQIATSYNGHFYRTNGNEGLGFLPNAGLSLLDARPQQSGHYSVQVQLLQSDFSLVTARRTVTLSITDTPPATQDGKLHVTQGDVIRDDVTKDWRVPLYCGQFVFLGNPPVDVIWTTSSGEASKSRYEDNGTFVLFLPSLDQEGDYTYSCLLSPSAPAARCLNATSTLTAPAQLSVDARGVKLALLEVQLRETKAELRAAKAELQDLYLAGDRTNCADWLAVAPNSGVRTIKAPGQFMAVYCDQVTDNGGWLVFQRRVDASVDFYRNWTEYRNGFGDLEGNVWLGLDKLHVLTTSQKFELRVDMTMWDGTRLYATYGDFHVDNASLNFALRFHNFTGGNASDSLSYHRNQAFSTKDREHDKHHIKNCARMFRGAWWYWACMYSNLNGVYKANGTVREIDAVSWSNSGGSIISMKFSEMKIRPM